MTKADKRLQKMRHNPRDWRIEDLQSVADSLGVEWVHDGGSHAVFRSPTGAHLTVPAKRPIKPVYVKLFLDLMDQAKEAENENSRKQI